METKGKYICEKLDFNRDINVNVFEANIRVLGGLISGHLISSNKSMVFSHGYEGCLLRKAVSLANRLLSAFETNTGMPYGTVNLVKGFENSF